MNKKKLIYRILIILTILLCVLQKNTIRDGVLSFCFNQICFNGKDVIPYFLPNGSGRTTNFYYDCILWHRKSANSFLLRQKGNYRETKLIYSPFAYMFNAENVALMLLIDINSDRSVYSEIIKTHITYNRNVSTTALVQLMQWIGNDQDRFDYAVSLL